MKLALNKVTLCAAAVLFSSAAFAEKVVNNTITLAEVKAAQQAWGEALINISNTHEQKGAAAAKAVAKQVLDAAYGYNMGAVLFKPTLANGEQTFRTTYDGALSYLVAGDKNFAQDGGFALKGWKKYEYENAGVYLNGDLALTMGHVHVTDKSGKTTTVDKTWGFKKDAEGKLRIVLHHSSLPYAAN